MEFHSEAFCWGLCLSMLGWGFIAGWMYWRYRYCRSCLGAMLFIIGKANKRGVYFAPYDVAVVNVAIRFFHHTK